MTRWMTSMMLLLLVAGAPAAVYAQDGESSDADETEAEAPKGPKGAKGEAEDAAEDAADAVEDAAEAAEDGAEAPAEAAEEAAVEEAAETVAEAAADGEAPADEGKPKPKFSLVAEAGVVWLAGNTQSITANGGIAFGLKAGRHGFKLGFGGNYGRSVVKTEVDEDGDGTIERVDSEWATTATRVFGTLRYDVSLIPDVNSIYAGFGAFHDPFAGYVVRARGDLGYAHTIVNTPVHNLVGEAGLNYTRDLYVDDPLKTTDDDVATRTQNFLGARVYAGYTLTPNDAFGFFVNAEVLLGGTDNAEARFDGRLTGETGITANLSKVFSIKLGFLVGYDFVPPDLDGDGVRDLGPLDTTTTATLVATLF